MVSGHEPLLVNTIAHAAGTIIFGIFLSLLFRDYGASRLRSSWLSISAAVLAFAWNLGSFVVLSVPSMPSWAADLVVAISFSALSLLPAVLLHVSLGSERPPRLIVSAGYILSSLAVALHFAELATPQLEFHQPGLALITAGFVVLTIAALVWISRKATTPKLLATMGLALFAVSFVHFGSGHGPRPWSSELILHHAGIPVALFILLQDFRFVLLDAFIRFLANALLAAVFIFFSYRLALTILQTRFSLTPFQETVLLLSACLVLVMFAVVRTALQRFLTRVVFRRTDFDKTAQRLRSSPPGIPGEHEYLEWAAQQVGSYVATSSVQLNTPAGLESTGAELSGPMLAAEVPTLRINPDLRWVEAVVPLRLIKGDLHHILLGRREGGRRYLSEDLHALGNLAALITDQIEHFRELEMQRLVAQAELRALQSQINPHFLFNALNTLYGTIPREAYGARRMVMNLAEVFRYCLRSDKTFIPLSEELQIVRAYLEVEELRLGSRLRAEIDVDQQLLDFPIPILSIQPLVENAVKHGVAPHARAGWIRVRAKGSDGMVTISVEDSGGSFPGVSDEAGAGIGMSNVSRRLRLCYGEQSELAIESGRESTRVQFTVPLSQSLPARA